jgi:hypothetical protein
MANPKVRDWTPDEKKLLGTGPDEAIARRLKRPLSGVIYWRQRLKIPPWHRR